jgi:hypothetical protein
MVEFIQKNTNKLENNTAEEGRHFLKTRTTTAKDI